MASCLWNCYLLRLLNFIFITQVAWSVARTTSSSGSMYPVRYDRVLVNLGNSWNPSSNTVTIPRTGYYLLHIGHGGGLYRRFSYLSLHVNNVREFSLRHLSTNHNGVDTMSRSGILHLSSGDQVNTRCDHGLYSDRGLQSIFIGLLLY